MIRWLLRQRSLPAGTKRLLAQTKPSSVGEAIGLPLTQKELLQCRRLEGQCIRQELENARQRGEVIPKTVVVEVLHKILGALIPRVEQILCNEYPTAVAGLDIPAARIYGKRVFDIVLGEFQRMAEFWRVPEAVSDGRITQPPPTTA